MALADYSIDFGALVRARNKAFEKFDATTGGYGRQASVEKLDALNASCALVIKASSGQEVEGVSCEPDVYDGKDALLILTPRHKIVCLKVGLSSQQFKPIAIFDR